MLKRIRAQIRAYVNGPTPLERAARELHEARCDLLLTQTRFDYEKATAAYHKARIERLEAYIKNNVPDTSV